MSEWTAAGIPGECSGFFVRLLRTDVKRANVADMASEPVHVKIVSMGAVVFTAIVEIDGMDDLDPHEAPTELRGRVTRFISADPQEATLLLHREPTDATLRHQMWFFDETLGYQFTMDATDPLGFHAVAFH